ncbi:flocculation-associated PEP-CTERM protein PepA [Methylococcus sp. EFPC2]|uniref:flocculation-associated PEP-CTERM protein PepA n=1 Tax=Methylococcus sp. EFPC2 TaxID=2812648 RepID=UPI001966DF3D|nr:flocculation-associated PEP-CTERM protein PepA [Methylococcus sp. EFPC2]QSA97281.1 flocculation-associated PEP-CTERM protein PepA [Methylococcus sp. EFPC2]
MNGNKPSSFVSIGLEGVLILVAFAGVAQAAPTPWKGIADYKSAPGSVGDEDLVGPFSTYDFGTGVVLSKLISGDGQHVGDVFQGYYQTYVQGHELNALPVSAGGLNSNYELTVVAEFQETITGITAFGPTFSVTGGSAALYFDTSPDRSYVSDSGFNNGVPILTGRITSGSAFFVSPIGMGSSQFELSLNGTFSGYNSAVYEPDTIGGGIANFNLRATLSDLVFLNTISTVQGESKVGNILLAGDGGLQLTTAVPIPFAGWLFGAALVGLTLVHRQKSDL